MTYTSTSVVNEALAAIGYDGAPVTGAAPNFDSSIPGIIAAEVYSPCVEAVARAHQWSFARTTAALSATGNAAPFPWSYEYAFPAYCVDVWQLSPSSITDRFNPTPVTWARGISVVSGVQSSVIWTNLASARAVFNGNPHESAWDSIFHQSVVNYLAHRFAIANLGKPDLMAAYLEEWGQTMQLGIGRDDQ